MLLMVVVVAVYLRGALLPLAIGLAGHNPLDGVGHTLPVTGCRAFVRTHSKWCAKAGGYVHTVVGSPRLHGISSEIKVPIVLVGALGLVESVGVGLIQRGDPRLQHHARQ